MITNHLIHSIIKSQLGLQTRHFTVRRSLQFYLHQIPLLIRLNSTTSSSLPEMKPGKGSKGHDMLAPFTAGWQTTGSQPLVIEKSEGCYVYDVNGKKYLDALAGLWCTALGGNETRLVAAATAQWNTLPFYHSFWNRTSKPSLDLARDLLEFFTARQMEKVFFTNSGSDANDSQVKLVWYYNNALGRPKKKKFIARAKSYHGSTLIAASLSGLPALHQEFDLPAPFVLHTDCPHYWRYHLPGETEEEFSTRLVNNLENLILKEGPETVAAFIAEPVMGAGGVILPPKTYFEKVQDLLKKYDILFVVDEVICGFGRLGTMFGCDKYCLKPDLVTVAKALSSAYMPIAAVLVSPEVSDVIHSQSNKLGSFSHGFTYSGHPVSCAVAIETLKIYKERNILKQINSISPRFQDGLKAFSNSPIIGEIRGVASLSGKVEKEVEIKASPEQYYNIFRKQSHQIPNIANKNIHHVELHEGDYQTHGSIKTWKYTTGDEVKTLKARTEFDDVNKKTTFVGLGGDAMKYYKVLNIAYQAIPKGDGHGSLVKLSVEYEKLNEDVPVPNMYLDTMTTVTKDMDEHLINA